MTDQRQVAKRRKPLRFFWEDNYQALDRIRRDGGHSDPRLLATHREVMRNKRVEEADRG